MRSARFQFVSSVLITMAVAALMAPAARAGAPPNPVTYRPPVDAPISDPFRPPPHRFGPGNRGIEYATETGIDVRAIGAGEVSFAGQVGGTLHVTVLHLDGFRSTVSFLESIVVRRGDAVVRGQVVGTSGVRTHLGVRVGDQYVDPAALFVGMAGEIRLVPTESAASATVADERAAIDEWLRLQPSLFDLAGEWLRGRADDAFVLASLLAHDFDAAGFVVDTGLELFDRLTDRPACTPPDRPVAPPASRRIVVLVGGLASTSDHAAVDDVDTSTLGYEAADVYRFSYRGGRVPDVGDRHQGVESNTYDALDSQSELWESAAELQWLVADLARLDPGVPVDIVAHSQGGLVTRLALDQMDTAGDTGALGAVVTLGTPHQGADLATAAAAVRSDAAATQVFEAIDQALGTGIEIDSPAVRQLAVGSPLAEQLALHGVPAGVQLTSVGARGDLVVAANRTYVEGAANITIPGSGPRAHDTLPSDPAATREIGLSIAGSPPTCESATDIVFDVFSGRLVSETQQLISTGILAGGLTVPG